MSDPISTYYSDTPSEVLDQNQRTWYDPILSDTFRRMAVFYGLVPYNMENLGAVKTQSMVITEILDAHANFDPIAFRAMWSGASHFDSRRRVVTFQRYGAKVAVDKSSDLVTYWQQGGSARNGVLQRLAQGQLGNLVVELNDALIRNAYLLGYNKTYQGTATDFNGIATTDLFDLGVLEDAWLRMSMGNVPLAMDPNLPNGNNGMMVCITSPGVVDTIQRTVVDGTLSTTNPFVAVNQYSQSARDMVSRYEIGTWKNTRFLSTPKMILYNCGAVTGQCQLDDAVSAGDGAPDPATTAVWDVYYTGQESAGVTNYIPLETGGAATLGVAVNDIISIHTDRTADGRADYTDGTKEDRIVVGIDGDNLTLDRPLNLDHAATAYVTLGRHIHCAITLGGPNGVVAGVLQQPRIYYRPPIDDFEMVHRWTFDQYLGYQVWDPEQYDVWFGAGPIRVTGGARTVQ